MDEQAKPLFYDYTASKAYAEQLGLVWLGDEFVRAADMDANLNGFTQAQVDIAMRHHLAQVLWLFTPANYRFVDRIKLAIHFLFNLKVKK